MRGGRKNSLFLLREKNSKNNKTTKQVTTCQGVVMGRLRSPQRQLEVDLMRFCFNKLGLPVRICLFFFGEVEREKRENEKKTHSLLLPLSFSQQQQTQLGRGSHRGPRIPRGRRLLPLRPRPRHARRRPPLQRRGRDAADAAGPPRHRRLGRRPRRLRAVTGPDAPRLRV